MYYSETEFELRAWLASYMKKYKKTCLDRNFQEMMIEMARIHGFLTSVMYFNKQTSDRLHTSWAKFYERCQTYWRSK